MQETNYALNWETGSWSTDDKQEIAIHAFSMETVWLTREDLENMLEALDDLENQ